jgi:hypothetical protein
MLSIRGSRRATLEREPLLPVVAVALAMTLSACSTTVPSTEPVSTEELASAARVEDRRGRFREILCAVLSERGPTLPDHRPCDEALTRVGAEPGGTGRSVALEGAGRDLVAVIVPGVGWACFSDWLDARGTTATHVRQFGYDMVAVPVDALSSTSANARQVRDAIMAMEQPEGAEPRLVLIGYSKGAPDILEALVAYPEIRPRIAAVVSAAGAIGGTPLAHEVTQSQLELLRHWPDAQCSRGDGGAIDSLRQATRRAWLAEHPLPGDLPYYSLVTCPEPGRISSALKHGYKRLSRVDARNDGMLLLVDQLIPGSTLLGYVNADHWALAVPIARSHPKLARRLLNHNDFPREALLEALLRFVEEDLESSAR